MFLFSLQMPTFAASNLGSENLQTNISPEIMEPQAISKNQPSEGFSGTCWITGDNVNIRSIDGTIIGQFQRGDSWYFDYVSNGKGYHKTELSCYTVDVSYLSTVKVS
jgi:hypothetical protein